MSLRVTPNFAKIKTVRNKKSGKLYIKAVYRKGRNDIGGIGGFFDFRFIDGRGRRGIAADKGEDHDEGEENFFHNNLVVVSFYNLKPIVLFSKNFFVNIIFSRLMIPFLRNSTHRFVVAIQKCWKRSS